VSGANSNKEFGNHSGKSILRETEGHMANAVKVLGLRSQQHLSQILNREFPDICDELDINVGPRALRCTSQDLI
jgi:hypothetical protein